MGIREQVERHFSISSSDVSGWPLVFISLFAGVIRLWELTADDIAPGYRNDETFTLELIQQDASQIVELTAQDVHPPLYYLVARAWGLVFGMTIPAQRVLSVLFAVASIAILYHIARYLAGEQVAIVGSLLLATSSFHIFQSQKARMYSLFLFLALTATYAYLKLRDTGETKYAAAYVAATVLLAYTHVFAVFVAAFHAADLAIHLWETRDRRVLMKYVASAVTIGVLVSPWLVVFARQVTAQSNSLWIQTPGLHRYLWAVEKGYAGSLTLAIAFALLIGMAVVDAVQRETARSVFRTLMLWATIPIALPVIATYTIQPVFVTRYTLMALPGLYLLVAIGVANRTARTKTWVLAFLAGLISINLYNYFVNHDLGSWFWLSLPL